MPFDPKPYLTKLKGKDYLEVKYRLLWLRTDHPEAIIETEPIRLETELAVFRAKVTLLHNGASATGYGSETKRDFGDFLEKAETKALGRALGALGYGTQFGAEFDEGTEPTGERNVVDSPVPATPRAAQPAVAGEPRPPQAEPQTVSPELVAAWEAARKLAAEIGWSPERVAQEYVVAYRKRGVQKPADLTLEMVQERNQTLAKFIEGQRAGAETRATKEP